MRFILGLLIVIGVIVLVFVLILRAFSGPSSSPSVPKPLVDYANTSTTVEMTIDGMVNSNQDHQALQIIIGENQATINILQGYEGAVTTTQSYNNNQDAYGVFLRSIDLAGFTKGSNNPALSDDRGYCAEGERYIFQIYNGSQNLEHYWATSCGDQGTFKGDVDLIKQLFIGQIPNYDQLTSNLSLF